MKKEELESRFHLLDGLAQKARDSKLNMADVNLALSVLLENELSFLAALTERSRDQNGVVVNPQDEIITERLRTRTPSPLVHSSKGNGKKKKG